MKATITLDHGMSFRGMADSGFTVNLGASPRVGGEDDGFRPMELILIGLAGCTAMDVISILRKKRQHVTGYQVTAEATRAEDHPHVFEEVVVTHHIEGAGVDPDAVERSIELSKTKYCPVQAMLGQTVNISHEFEISAAG